MNKNSLIIIIIVLLVIAGVVFLVLARNNNAQNNNLPSTNTADNNLSLPEINRETKKVSLKNFAFSPAELTISQGETVIWLNEDTTTHTVKFSDIESEQFSQNETFQKTFNQPGTFNYSCGLHPNMTGTITVQ